MGSLSTKLTPEQTVKMDTNSIQNQDSSATKARPLDELKKDMTLQELREYDGKQADGRILVAVNGNIYDVSEKKNFYGQNAPYAVFAGRDATRGFATFKIAATDNENDDFSDLTEKQVASAKQWEEKFQKQYPYVGKIIRN